MEGPIRIRMRGWRRFALRADVKGGSWLKFPNAPGTIAEIHGLDGGECWVWAQLYSCCSREGSDTFDIDDLEWFAEQIHSSREAIVSTIQKLEKKRFRDEDGKVQPLLEVVSQAQPSTEFDRTRTDSYEPERARTDPNKKERQTERETEKKEDSSISFFQDGTGPPTEPEFREILKIFPRRTTMAVDWERQALDAFREEIRSREAYRRFREAFVHFARRHFNAEPKFIPGWKSFLANWASWLGADGPYTPCSVTGYAGNQPVCHHGGTEFCVMRELYLAEPRAG